MKNENENEKRFYKLSDLIKATLRLLKERCDYAHVPVTPTNDLICDVKYIGHSFRLLAELFLNREYPWGILTPELIRINDSTDFLLVLIGEAGEYLGSVSFEYNCFITEADVAKLLTADELYNIICGQPIFSKKHPPKDDKNK